MNRNRRVYAWGSAALLTLLAVTSFVVTRAVIGGTERGPSGNAAPGLGTYSAGRSAGGALAKFGAVANLVHAKPKVKISAVRSGLDTFTFRDTALPGPKSGEPSIAVDKFATSPRKGSVYVSAITPALWHSTNLGQTWSNAVPFDDDVTDPKCQPVAGGGDSDVIALPNGNLVVADLALADNVVQVSTDGGQTFGPCFATGPESDRPWLGNNGSNFVYLAYHDLAGEVPIVCSSLDGGSTWGPCNETFNNLQVTQCAENTVMSRPVVVDPVDSSIHLMYSCSTALENATHPPWGPLHDYFAANSFGPIVMGQPTGYTTATIFTADSSNGKAPNYANIFSTMRTDSAGNYYAVFNGTADDNHVLTNPYHVYLTVSKDKGVTWSAPIQVDHDLPNPVDPVGGRGTHVFADIMPTTPGNVDIIWLGAPSTGEPNGQCGSTGMVHNCMDGTQNVGMQPGGPIPGLWNVFMAQSTNALSPTPTFTTVPVTTSPMHNGEVCTNGIVCGSSDRSLLDYISVDVDCNGNAHIAYSSNFTASPPASGNEGPAPTVHAVDQIGGPTIGIPPTCFAPTAVKLRSFTARREQGRAVLRWRTANELGNSGFNVYATTKGRRVRLNQRLIYSTGTGTARGRAYTWRDSRVRGATRYWLQEVHADGTRRFHGPLIVR